MKTRRKTKWKGGPAETDGQAKVRGGSLGARTPQQLPPISYYAFTLSSIVYNVGH